jgi:hypothetical protein
MRFGLARDSRPTASVGGTIVRGIDNWMVNL